LLSGGQQGLIAPQTDMNHLRDLVDVEFTVERDANLVR
jgi:hypothetical protein